MYHQYCQHSAISIKMLELQVLYNIDKVLQLNSRLTKPYCEAVSQIIINLPSVLYIAH